MAKKCKHKTHSSIHTSKVSTCTYTLHLLHTHAITYRVHIWSISLIHQQHIYMTNGRRLVLAFTFKLGQKQAQLRSAMETVKICSRCVGSTINAGSGFHCSSVLRLSNCAMGDVHELASLLGKLGYPFSS